MVIYKQYFNFLTEEQNLQLFEQTIQSKKEFSNSTVIDYSNDYPNWRSSTVRFDDGTFDKLNFFKKMVCEKYVEVCNILKIEELSDYSVDVQLTAHGDGDYFRQHTDAGTPETNNRVVTFVYYFHKVPKMYSGGELIIYSNEVISIVPENNMVVFFDPKILHEVQRVKCSEKRFENSRFTLNGWILQE